MTPAYVIEAARPEDAAHIGELSLRLGEDSEIHTTGEFAAWWNWLYVDNPVQAGSSLVATDSAKRVVGHCGLVPFRYATPGGGLTGGFICQLMVDTEYRRSLLFPTMEKRLLNTSASHGFDFCYGLVNRPHVVKAHGALGFRLVGRVPIYARPYKLQPLLNARLKGLSVAGRVLAPAADAVLRLNFLRAGAHLAAVGIERFGPEADGLFRQVARHFKICANRSAEMLNWRFVDAPGRNYEIWGVREGTALAGYVALRRMSLKGLDALVIADLLFDPDRRDVGSSLLAAAHGRALAHGVDLSVCLMNDAAPFLPLLKRAGFIKTPEALTLILHGSPSTAAWCQSSALADWHVTWFDHDYN